MTIPMVFRLLLGTFSEIRDMKRTMAFMGFALFAVLIPSSFGQSLEPKELSEARNAYKAELQKAIKPVNDRYLPKLEGLKNQLTYKGDIRSAVAVDDIITSIQNGNPRHRNIASCFGTLFRQPYEGAIVSVVTRGRQRGERQGDKGGTRNNQERFPNIHSSLRRFRVKISFECYG